MLFINLLLSLVTILTPFTSAQRRIVGPSYITNPSTGALTLTMYVESSLGPTDAKSTPLTLTEINAVLSILESQHVHFGNLLRTLPTAFLEQSNLLIEESIPYWTNKKQLQESYERRVTHELSWVRQVRADLAVVDISFAKRETLLTLIYSFSGYLDAIRRKMDVHANDLMVLSALASAKFEIEHKIQIWRLFLTAHSKERRRR